MSPGTITCEGCGVVMAAYKATCPRCGRPTTRPVLPEPIAPPVVPLTLPPPAATARTEQRRGLPVSAAVLAPMALLLLVVVFLIGRHDSGPSPSVKTPGTGARIAAAAAVDHPAPTITPKQPTNPHVAAGLTAHGHVISRGPSNGRCPLEGTALTATGDDGSTIGATQLHGEATKGSCTYAFWFPVTDAVTVTFHVDPYRVIGPDRHDAQVSGTALKKDLVLSVG